MVRSVDPMPEDASDEAPLLAVVSSWPLSVAEVACWLLVGGQGKGRLVRRFLGQGWFILVSQ